MSRFKMEWKELDKVTILICLITAFFTITICSKSSFLYPINDWVDSNCFFTVGKSMMNGVVVYRDLLEQKGPFLYFLHGIGWLISRDTFFGVYLIEIVAAFFFLYYGYGIVKELWEDAASLVIPVMAFLVYTTDAFRHGDSAEELCLPFLMYALWVVIKALHRQEEIGWKEYFIIGLTSGCVFWTKFTMVGFYIGWFIVPALVYIAKRRWKKLGQAILTIAAGVSVATIPYVIYFGIHGAIGDWIKVYIFDNIFNYSLNTGESAGLLSNLDNGWYSMMLRNKFAVFSAMLGAIMLIPKRERLPGLQVLLTFGATFFFTYMGGRILIYYSLVFSVFVPYGIAILGIMAVRGYPEIGLLLNRRWVFAIGFCFCTMLTFHYTPNQYLIGVDKSEMPQYQFKEIIDQVEDASLLNYGFLDGGFYTTANIIPNCKAFCRLNIPSEEISYLQDYYAEEGLCDFIVTRNQEIDFPKYECVARSSFMFEDIMFDYYLYQLK